MRHAVLIALASAAVLAAGGSVFAGKDKVATRKQIEADLTLTARPLAGARVRPGEPMRLEATLTNGSESRTHKVIDPGAGSELGYVEPFVYYTARHLPHEGKARDIVGDYAIGMCGIGDHRWMRRVQDLAPGKSLEFGSHMACPSMTLDLDVPGRYDVRVHYEFRAKGTTQAIPQSDPIGKLGPMKGVPAFKVSSEPVRFDVVRPFEVFVEVTGKLEKDVTMPVSRILTVRVENWSKDIITLHNDKLQIRLEPSSKKGTPRLDRMRMFSPAIVLEEELAPGEGLTVIGPKGRWHDEEWTLLDDGPVQLRVIVTGYTPDAEPVESHAVKVPGA